MRLQSEPCTSAKFSSYPLAKSRTGPKLVCRCSPSNEDRLDDFIDGALAVVLVGQRPCYRDGGRASRRNPLLNQLARVDQQPRRDAFLQPRGLQMTQLFAPHRQLHRLVEI